MKKKSIAVLSLVLVVLVVANTAMMVNNQRKSTLIGVQEAELVAQMEKMEHNVQIIKEQQGKIEEMEQYIRTVQNEQSKLLEEMEAKKEKIKSLEFQINQYINSTPFEMLKITEIQNYSNLKQDKEFPERHFEGTISLRWEGIPDASGYQIEFNHAPMLEEITDTYYYCTGAFYSYKVDISEGLKFRIRAYKLQDGEKVYGEFSEWTSLEVE